MDPAAWTSFPGQEVYGGGLFKFLPSLLPCMVFYSIPALLHFPVICTRSLYFPVWNWLAKGTEGGGDIGNDAKALSCQQNLSNYYVPLPPCSHHYLYPLSRGPLSYLTLP